MGARMGPIRRRTAALFVVMATLAAVVGAAGGLGSTPAGAGPPPAPSEVRLAGSTVPGLSHGLAVPTATPAGAADRSLTLTVTLTRTDQAGFTRYLAAVSSPSSPEYHRYLSQAQVTAAFGPSRSAYATVRAWLVGRGLTVVRGSGDRLTLTVRGTEAQVEHAFAVSISYYRFGARTVYATTSDPALPAGIAPDVQSIAGLDDLSRPVAPGATARVQSLDAATSGPGTTGSAAAPASGGPTPGTVTCVAGKCTVTLTVGGKSYTLTNDLNEQCLPLIIKILALFFIPGMIFGVAWIAPLAIAVGMLTCIMSSGGAFQNVNFSFTLGGHSTSHAIAHLAPPPKIGLLEFDGYRTSDVADWLAMLHLQPNQLQRLSSVAVDGGVATPGNGESEVLLDIDTVLLMTLESQADVVVYDAPSSTSFETMFNTMIGDHDTVISNSWTQCEDQTPRAEATAIDSVLQQAEASGVTVLNSSGDTGPACLDGSPGTVGVPADSPSATAVGGSTYVPGPGGTAGVEGWWDGSGGTPATGQGGFGVSRDFPRPAYQNGLTSASGRSVPDVVAPADPAEGPEICQADAGGCPDGLSHGGTSIAAPEWAATVANLDTALGHDIGNLNAALYPLAGTAAFRTGSAMGSNFAHVGLGDAVTPQLFAALAGVTAGAVSPTVSTAVAIGDGSALDADGTTVAADGTSRGTVRADLVDAGGTPVSGKSVSLTPDPGCHATVSTASGPSDGATGAVTFTVTDTTVESCTFTVTDTGDSPTVTVADQPTLTFAPPVATGASISAGPNDLPADGTTASTVIVYLQDGLGRPAAGKTVTLTQTGTAVVTPAGSSTPGLTAVTDAQGDARFSVTDTTAQDVQFTAVDTSDGNLPVPGTASITFTSGSVPACGGTSTGTGGWGVTHVSSGYHDDPYSQLLPGNFSLGACDGLTLSATDAGGNLYVANSYTGTINVLPPGGGQPSAANQLPDANFGRDDLSGLAFGKDGSLYAALSLPLPAGVNNNEDPEIVQLDPKTGATLRVVASESSSTPLTYCPSGLAVDPLTGDLFVSGGCSGYLYTGHIQRIADPSSSNPTVTNYASVNGIGSGIPYQIAFAPDGTLYTTVGGGEIVKVGGTDTTQPAAVTSLVAYAPGSYGVGLVVSGTGSGGTATGLLADDFSGNAYTIDLTQNPPAVTKVVSGGASGWFGYEFPGVDGCAYLVEASTLDRVGTGPCASGGTLSTAPTLTLTTNAGATPATGTSASFTATLANVSSPGGTPISFSVTGPNTRGGQVPAGGRGAASYSLAGIDPGTDTVVAEANVGGTVIVSNPLQVHWVHGKDTAFLSMDESQQAGPALSAATIRATLVDVSATPPQPVAGATVSLSVGTGTCTTTTSADGSASCPIPPGTTGDLTQRAVFAGNSTLTPATGTTGFSASPGGTPPPKGPVKGYWEVAADGGVFAFGAAQFYGSTGDRVLNRPVVGLAATPDGKGYWLVASDGGIFAFGDARFYGSTGNRSLTAPVVGMAATPDGKGYWLVASDGGVFAFGDARFYGSAGGTALHRPMVGMASTADGKGYWLVASDGGVFTYGDATFHGSEGARVLNRPVVGMAGTPDRGGYWLVASDGGVFAFGDAGFDGSEGGTVLARPVVGIASSPDGLGYWLDATDGGIFSFGDAAFYGSMGGLPLHRPMVGMTLDVASG